MATLRPRGLISAYHTNWPGKSGAKLVQWSLDFRRALILGKRAKTIWADLTGKDPNTRDHEVITPYRESMKGFAEVSKELAPNVSEHTGFKSPGTEIVNDAVYIVDIDYFGFNEGRNVIRLPFIPKELNYNCESSFAAIRPIGRNNPNYHFTGAEDLLEFEIDWYSFESNRKDVITKCREIEALSKNDGYDNPPHRVLLKWGEDNILFRGYTFLVLKAPYRLVQFNKAQRNSQGKIESTSMLPVQAYQTVTLARITDHNLLRTEIEYVSSN